MKWLAIILKDWKRGDIVKIGEIFKRKKESDNKKSGGESGADVRIKLIRLNARMLEEVEKGNVFEAAFIAERIRLLAEEHGIYPKKVDWRIVRELERKMENWRVGLDGGKES